MNRVSLSLAGLAFLALLTFAGARGLFSGASATPGSGTLFGTDAGAAILLTINPSNGVSTVVGPMDLTGPPAVAFSPTSGVAYVGSGGQRLIFTL